MSSIKVDRAGVVRRVLADTTRTTEVEVEFSGSPLPTPGEVVFFSPEGFDHMLREVRSDLRQSEMHLRVAQTALDRAKSDLAAARSSLRFGRVLFPITWAAVTLTWLVLILTWTQS